jgi:hypothetical protein
MLQKQMLNATKHNSLIRIPGWTFKLSHPDGSIRQI